MAKAITSGKPKGKPRGKPFKKGVSPNPGGVPKGELSPRRIDMDARLLAREHGVEAVHGLITMMRGVVKVTTTDPETKKPVEVEVIVPPTAMITAMSAILDRGYGRPPQALEIYGGDVHPEEREGSALEIITRQLDQQAERERQEGGPRQLRELPSP
jgi:hypothetical protein